MKVTLNLCIYQINIVFFAYIFILYIHHMYFILKNILFNWIHYCLMNFIGVNEFVVCFFSQFVHNVTMVTAYLFDVFWRLHYCKPKEHGLLMILNNVPFLDVNIYRMLKCSPSWSMFNVSKYCVEPARNPLCLRTDIRRPIANMGCDIKMPCRDFYITYL